MEAQSSCTVAVSDGKLGRFLPGVRKAGGLNHNQIFNSRMAAFRCALELLDAVDADPTGNVGGQGRDGFAISN